MKFVVVVAALLLVAASAIVVTNDHELENKHSVSELNQKHGYQIPKWATGTDGKIKTLGGGLKKNKLNPTALHVVTPQPHEDPNFKTPTAVNWANVSGQNYLTSSRNQHIPNYCGSCWAMASTSGIADRIRIMRKAQFPDYMIAVQNIVYCVPHGCWGGDPDDVHAYIHNNSIGPDTCQNYVAFGGGTNGECASGLRRCENCMGDTCNPITKFPEFGVSEYGHALGVEQMKAEIAARGPIACGIDSSPISAWGWGPNKDKIFTGGKNLWAIDHEIGVTGFGVDETSGVSYWIIRNSWGEYWGDNGYFRLEMGSNQLGIEGSACSWAVPTIPDNLKAKN